MHPSSSGGSGNIGPNGGAVLHQQQPPPSSLSLAIANNYRAQYQHQQIPPFNSLPSKYGPVHPTNIPQHALHPQSAPPLPVQVFYGQPGQSGGGGSNGRPPKLNNQPYVIVSGGGGGPAHPNHRQHPQHPQSHPGQQQQQQQLQFEQGNENQHHNLLTSPEVIKPINPFDDM